MVKKILVILLGAMLLFSCAAGPNDFRGQAREDSEPAGFWMGLWHGIIAPFAFIVSLFKHDVNVYEVYNSGGWYNFGFIIGLSIIFGGPKGAGSIKKRRKYRKHRSWKNDDDEDYRSYEEDE